MVKYVIDKTCNNGPCQIALRKKVQTKIQKLGNIANLPCKVRYAGKLATFSIAATFSNFISSSK